MIYNRGRLISILVYHQRLRVGGGCHCGWNQWGGSYAAHIADVYEHQYGKVYAPTMSDPNTPPQQPDPDQPDQPQPTPPLEPDVPDNE